MAARIFISSTTEDLREHRRAVVAALRARGDEPIVLEDLAPDGVQPPLGQSRQAIASCDLLIGLVAWRYGYVPASDNPDGYSFTELELRYAWSLRLPTLVFLVRDEAPWPRHFVDTGAPAEKL